MPVKTECVFLKLYTIKRRGGEHNMMQWWDLDALPPLNYCAPSESSYGLLCPSWDRSRTNIQQISTGYRHTVSRAKSVYLHTPSLLNYHRVITSETRIEIFIEKFWESRKQQQFNSQWGGREEIKKETNVSGKADHHPTISPLFTPLWISALCILLLWASLAAIS